MVKNKVFVLPAYKTTIYNNGFGYGILMGGIIKVELLLICKLLIV